MIFHQAGDLSRQVRVDASFFAERLERALRYRERRGSGGRR